MPEKELKRLQTIHRFLNLHIDKDVELQEIAVLATELLDCPIAFITTIKGDTQHFLYKVGIESKQDNIKNSFCRYIEPPDLFVVPDALEDERFRNSSLVIEPPFVRFYAGAALLTHDGHQLGSICVMDTKPKEITGAQRHLLKVLAKRIIQIIEFDFSINLLKEQFLKSRESEIKLRSFFETSSALHLLVDRERNVLDFNRNMSEFLFEMYDVHLIQGMPVSDVLQGDSLSVFIRDFNKALNGEAVMFERKVTYRDQREIWWYVTFEPGRNPEGQIIGISYNATDITERKMHEALILNQNEVLKEIAFMQSHELRKPVATIMGLVGLMKAQEHDCLNEELEMLERASRELDEKIKLIVSKITQ